MKRRLKVSCKLHSLNKYFDLTVVEQTHTRLEFSCGQGRTDAWATKLFVHGTVGLISHMTSQFRVDEALCREWCGYRRVGVEPCEVTKLLFLRGSYQDPTVITDLPIEWFEPVKAAILAYNEAYKE